jgi:hypothetical protein
MTRPAKISVGFLFLGHNNETSGFTKPAAAVTWGIMASRFLRSCSPDERQFGTLPFVSRVFLTVGMLVVWSALAPPAHSQFLIKPSEPGDQIRIMPSDLAILESGEARKDIPCTVTQRKPEIGFDLRFHSGYELLVPMRELAGDGELLTVLFRVSPPGESVHAAYFVQHFRVPPIDDDAKGEAVLEGIIDLGEGRYHIDWLMRDREERLCSSSWDVEAELPAKDRPMPLFIGPNEIAETLVEPFVNEGTRATPGEARARPDSLDVKLLVNFAPQNSLSSALQRTDTDALVSILKSIQRDPHVGRISLVAFNIEESRVIYRQEAADEIDFPALGRALHTVRLGTVNVVRLGQRHSQTDFLEDLIQKEIGTSSHPDGVIFAGPKAMLDADVPQDDLRRIGDIECPVFYMNYNLNPQAVPWKDSISHAIRAFKGTEYTISRPRDLWLSTSDVVNRIIRNKRQHALSSAATGGSQ